MDFREQILKDIARIECEKIGKKVISQLQRRKDRLTFNENGYCFLSRKITGLKTVWDEICVQQNEAKFSVYWDYFDLTVNDYIEAELKKLPESIIKAIWLQTDKAFDEWESYESGEEEIRPLDEELVKYIAEEFVYEKARRWSNSRIENYLLNELYRDYEEFEPMF
jgi:hypothetical protein